MIVHSRKQLQIADMSYNVVDLRHTGSVSIATNGTRTGELPFCFRSRQVMQATATRRRF